MGEAEPEYTDSRNGYKPKTLQSSTGDFPIQVPQDRNSDFEPRMVQQCKKNISEIEGKIIAMYARGMSVAQVSEQIQDIYGFEVCEGTVTAITNKLLPEIEVWQYPTAFSLRENNVIRKAAAYVILDINEEGREKVLSFTIGENESAKFWLKCHREPEQRLPPPESWQDGLSQRHVPRQGALPGNLGTYEKVDHARSELGTGLRGAGYHVSRPVEPELA